MLNNFTNKYSNAYGKISHRRINSIINAGFPVSINQFNISSEFIMRISNIDKLWYLPFIDVYMESIFHLSQNAQVSGKWVNEWNRIQKTPGDLFFSYYREENKPGKPMTYRVARNDFQVEFLNVQADAEGNPANHIHSALRTLPKDFGLTK
jgi:hypothetical protein